MSPEEPDYSKPTISLEDVDYSKALMSLEEPDYSPTMSLVEPTYSKALMSLEEPDYSPSTSLVEPTYSKPTLLPQNLHHEMLKHQSLFAAVHLHYPDEILLGWWKYDPKPRRLVTATLTDHGFLWYFIRNPDENGSLVPSIPTKQSETKINPLALADFHTRVEWTEEANLYLVAQSTKNLYRFVFAELYSRRRILPKQCVNAFVLGILTPGIFDHALSRITDEFIYGRVCAVAELDLGKIRFVAARRDTLSFLCEFANHYGKRHPRMGGVSRFSQRFFERIMEDMFESWRIIEIDLDGILWTEYLLTIADSTGYWRFRKALH